MTPAAVLLEACLSLGIRDPAEFYLLPPVVQSMWIEHTTNRVSGAYYRAQGRAPSTPEQARDAERRFLEAQARKRRGSDGPR